jgi:hypothetical protein
MIGKLERRSADRESDGCIERVGSQPSKQALDVAVDSLGASLEFEGKYVYILL